MDQERIIAVGLLTQTDLNTLGPSFRRAWPVGDVSCFSGLLQAIDEADRELRRAKDQEAGRPSTDRPEEI